MKGGRAEIGILQKMRIKNLRGGGLVRSDLKKIRLHLENVEKQIHPQLFYATGV